MPWPLTQTRFAVPVAIADVAPRPRVATTVDTSNQDNFAINLSKPLNGLCLLKRTSEASESRSRVRRRGGHNNNGKCRPCCPREVTPRRGHCDTSPPLAVRLHAAARHLALHLNRASVDREGASKDRPNIIFRPQILTALFSREQCYSGFLAWSGLLRGTS